MNNTRENLLQTEKLTLQFLKQKQCTDVEQWIPEYTETPLEIVFMYNGQHPELIRDELADVLNGKARVFSAPN